MIGRVSVKLPVISRDARDRGQRGRRGGREHASHCDDAVQHRRDRRPEQVVHNDPKRRPEGGADENRREHAPGTAGPQRHGGGEDLLGDRAKQLVATGEMVVDRHPLDTELGCQAAHAQRSGSLALDQINRRAPPGRGARRQRMNTISRSTGCCQLAFHELAPEDLA
jgi:hypothetical protein